MQHEWSVKFNQHSHCAPINGMPHPWGGGGWRFVHLDNGQFPFTGQDGVLCPTSAPPMWEIDGINYTHFPPTANIRT